MLTAVLLLAVALPAADPEVPLYVMGKMPGETAKPVPAAAFDKVRAGMTLREAADVLGPGFIPALSGTGDLRWVCADGRRLTVSHTTDPNAVLTTGGTGTARATSVRLLGKDDKPLALPAGKAPAPKQ